MSKPLVHQSSQVYQDCTNNVPTVYQSSKTVKRQSKQQKWPLLYQSSHVYQDYTNSVPIIKNSQKTVKTAKMTVGVPIVTCLHRVRRIHKAKWTICDLQWGDGWWPGKGNNRWGASTVRRLKRDLVVKTARLTWHMVVKTLKARERSFIQCDAFVSLTLSQWRDLRMGVMCGFRDLNSSASKRVLDSIRAS